DEVESPSVSAPHALARFEFESGRGNEGTKILMVEWEDDESTKGVRGDWHVTWEGMRAIFPAAPEEETKEADGLCPKPIEANTDGKSTVTEKGGAHRMYFLLQPGTAVPPIVALTFQPSNKENGAKETSYQTNPLPAIFPPALGASARSAGKKGVLHTIWAKQRLRSLQKEIDSESATNVESVGLTMAVQEKEWIEENFGVSAKPSGVSLTLQTSGGLENLQGQPRSPGPASPRSPGGSRLQEKLKGLRLGTTANELTLKQSNNPEGGFPPGQNPLSPESSDVAVSSFATIKGPRTQPLSSLAAKPAQRPVESQPAAARRIAPAQPPASILSQQQQMGGMGSLNSFGSMDSFGSMVPMTTSAPPPPASSALNQSKEDDEDLFALPISPRSPEMTKSPFSFAQQDTKRYLQ
ncbi:hypothetical protein NA57DRAFT_19591, partial [Rhizodiscina lignyota]